MKSAEVNGEEVVWGKSGVREEGPGGRGEDGDVGPGAVGVWTVCSSAALHVAKAKEINWEGWGEVSGVHAIGGREAVEGSTVGHSAGATDASDGEGRWKWLQVIEEGGVTNGVEGACIVPVGWSESWGWVECGGKGEGVGEEGERAMSWLGMGVVGLGGRGG